MHTSSEVGLELFLRSWWSKTYNRPLKDPLLLSYNVYELIYEYRDKVERLKAAELQLEEEADRIEDAKAQEALDWAEQEERKELEEASKKDNADEDEKWMLEQLKKQNGEDFGEDINLDFSE